MLNMQWRSLVMLLSGIIVIYIATLLQDIPYLHPEKVYTSKDRLWKQRPEELIVSTVGSYIYVTGVEFEVATTKPPAYIGTDKLKLGVQGVVKQFRRPISNLLTERGILKETDGWTLCFQHNLVGAVSKVSKRNIENKVDKDTWHFAVLYHQIEDVNSYNYIRLYYTSKKSDNDYTFEYKDIKLPGTTWINSIALEKDSLIFSRDLDKFEFHIMTLPTGLLQAPHSESSANLSLNTVRPGRLHQEYSQPASTLDYSVLFNRLYSPVKERYRVLSLNVHKTKYTFYANFTIADNVTRINSENESVEAWLGRERGADKYPVYDEDALQNVGYSAGPTLQIINTGSDYISIPKLRSTLSKDSKTVVFPYLTNKFVTLDYTTRIDILQQLQKIKDRHEQLYYKDQSRTSYLEEYFYWQPLTVVDEDIKGLQIDEEGEVLAVWTEYHRLHIYRRESNETKTEISLLGRLDRWLDYALSDVSDEERRLRQTYFPSSWELAMSIAPIVEFYTPQNGGHRPIGTAHFWTSDNNERFLCMPNKLKSRYLIELIVLLYSCRRSMGRCKFVPFG
ncbi:unnamed protein product [Mucor hiemalis]